MWKSNIQLCASSAPAVNLQALPALTAIICGRRNNSKMLCLAMVLVLALAGQAFRASAQAEVNLHSFGGLPDGENPRPGLVLASDHNFYGTTYSGGTNSSGTVFRLTPGGGYLNLYSFGSLPLDGAHPSAGLVQGSDGYLYGTTVGGGPGQSGTIFRISLSGSYSNLYSFQGAPNDGDSPAVGLTRGNDGNFYGVTQGGGTDNSGTVFRFTPGGTETMIYSFAGSPNDGFEPLSVLVLGRDGNFYGTTAFGGITNVASVGFVDALGLGTVFRISPGGSYKVLYLFGSAVPDGFDPGQLVQASDGNFYGVAFEGGTFTNRGAVFQITTGGSESLFYSFGSQPGDGSNPSSLIVGSDGNFYGTTTKGGTNDIGAVFRISPGGSETVLYSFGSQPNDGNEPLGGLVQGDGGNFYGTTLKGGAGNGTLFELTVPLSVPTNQITSIQITSSSSMVFTIYAVANETYQLQFSPSFSPPAWSNVPGASVTSSNGGPLTLTNSTGPLGLYGFFRVSISP
jgi:uncharacterized repeat protein (TIGR03803 family)